MILNVSIPEYNVDNLSNLKQVGKCIDKVLVKNFYGKKIVLRTLGSEEHKIPKIELLKKINELGYDRYDSDISGDRYDNIERKHIDLFGRPCTVTTAKDLSLPLLEGFHVYGAKFHGRQFSKRDIWLIYDRSALRAVLHMDKNRERVKRDGYAFKNAKNKSSALLGILVIE